MISKEEERQARHIKPPVDAGRVNIKVSIPVSVGGYTGQRDAWEERERNYDVSVEDDKVVLEESAGTIKRKVKFAKADLDAALRALNQLQPGSVVRNINHGGIEPGRTDRT